MEIPSPNNSRPDGKEMLRGIKIRILVARGKPAERRSIFSDNKLAVTNFHDALVELIVRTHRTAMLRKWAGPPRWDTNKNFSDTTEVHSLGEGLQEPCSVPSFPDLETVQWCSNNGPYCTILMAVWILLLLSSFRAKVLPWKFVEKLKPTFLPQAVSTDYLETLLVSSSFQTFV